MKHRRLLWLGIGAVAAVLLSMWALSPGKSSLPPLLAGATTGFGVVTDPCNGEIASSPELDQRLEKAFPPGSKEELLENTLSSQGFSKPEIACKSDSSIRSARFAEEQGKGLFPSITLMVADVYWKADEEGNIVWTKGRVRFIGP